jgi:hypothetical protein
VTAALDVEAAEIHADPELEEPQTHLASHWYPELGTILQDRPDPAGQFTIIGAKTATTYAEGHDPRDSQYNGDPDLGVYWQAPAQQQWVDDNLDEPEVGDVADEEAPDPNASLTGPDAETMRGRGEEPYDQDQFAKNVMARIEGTSMSGRPGTGERVIDGHGDAPGHGSDPGNPRAADPITYDAVSTEGQGDDKWSEPLSGVSKDDSNGAQVGMYPEGMSGGGGPGLGIGGFVARVPWTGQQRADLHGWDNEQAASAGDFVSSADFTNRHPAGEEQLTEPAQEVIMRELQMTGSVEDDPVWHMIHEHGMDPGDLGDLEEAHDNAHRFGEPGHAHPAYDLPSPAGQPEYAGQPQHMDIPWKLLPGDVADQVMHKNPWARQQGYFHAQSSAAYAPYDPAKHIHEHNPEYFGWSRPEMPDDADVEDEYLIHPADLATEEQHRHPEQRREVMHTLSRLGDDPAQLHRHVQEVHGWDRQTADKMYASGGIEAQHDAEHGNAAGNVHHTPEERGLCAYVHQGECAWPGDGMTRIGESLRHSRPGWLTTRMDELDDTDRIRARHVTKQGHGPTHVITGYRGSTPVGQLHFEQSDDGRALHVNMLHSERAGGKGVASALMDELYSHANRAGAWINHGWRTQQGLSWWNSYNEPHPELSTHRTHPDEPMQASPLHPGGASWSSYFAPTDVASDMHRNHDNDQRRQHRAPHFDHLDYPFDPQNSKWRRARPYPMEESDAKLDDLAAQHGWSMASLQAEAGTYDYASEHRWEDHMIGRHGWTPDMARETFQRGNRISDMHDALHEAGMADHSHYTDDDFRDERRHEEEVSSRFGVPLPDMSRSTHGQPQRGGYLPVHGDPGRALTHSDPVHARDPEDWSYAERARFYSSLQAEALNKKRADAVYGQLSEDFPHDAISWVHGKGVRWHGPYDADPSEINWDGRETWSAYNQPQKVGKSAEKAQKKRDKGKSPKPAIGTRGPGQDRTSIQDGHHRALGALVNDEPLSSYVAEVPENEGPWDQMHSQQFTGGDTGKQRGPDGTDEERDAFHDTIEGKVSRLNDDREAEDSLDHGEPGGEKPAGKQEAPPPAKAKGKKAGRPPVVPPQRHGNPSTWPLATAPVQDGYPALSEGTYAQPKHLKNQLPLQLPTDSNDPNESDDSSGSGDKPGVNEKTGSYDDDFPVRRALTGEVMTSANMTEGELRHHMRHDHHFPERVVHGDDLPGIHEGEHRRSRLGHGHGEDPAPHPDDAYRWADASYSPGFVASKRDALAAFTAAAGSESFRFEFTATWKDVLAKAKRIRKAGRVRIVHSSAAMVIGEVGGDHDVYEAGIQRPPHRPQTIQHWACGCPWASFRQDKSLPGRLNGRPCSHVMALQLESTSRGGSRGKDILRDPHLHEMGLPTHDVVVKSMPPWGPGGWDQTWIAPAASLHTATPDEARDGDWPPEERDRYEGGTNYMPWPPDEEHLDIPSRAELAHGWERPDWEGETEGRSERYPIPNVADMTQNAPRGDKGVRRYETHRQLDAETQNWVPDMDDPHYQAPHIPAHLSALALLAAGEKRKDVEALAAAAGIKLGELSPSTKLIERHLAVAHGIQGDKVAGWRERGQGPDVMHYRLHQGRAAMVMPHTHKRDEQTGQLTGPQPIQQQAAANDPWGDNNLAAHPPQKPYGATSPPRPDMSPGSYGPLAGPDPEDWGEIEMNGLQQPFSSEAARRGHDPVLASPQDQAVAPTYQSPPARDLDYPDVADWQQRSDTFPYAAQSNTAGPSTPLEPRDPNGIRMEESRTLNEAAGRAAYRSHMIHQHGKPDEPGLEHYYEGHRNDHRDMEAMTPEDMVSYGITPHNYHEMSHERHNSTEKWPDAGGYHEFTGSADRELPDPTAELGEQHHHPECECPTCDYNRYHAKHIFEGAMAAALAELRDHPEPALPLTTAEEPTALDPSATGGGPGMSMHDEDLSPDDTSIQSMGASGLAGTCARCGGQENEQLGPVRPESNGAHYHGECWASEVADENCSRLPGASQMAYGDTFRSRPTRYLDPPRSHEDLMDHLTAEHGVTYSGDKDPADRFLLTLHGQFHDGVAADRPPEGAEPHQHEVPDGHMDPVFGTQQAGTGDVDSGDLAISNPAQDNDPVAAFQATAAAQQYAGEGQPQGDGDVAAAAKEFLAKTAEVLPAEEADALIREGRGQRARNLDLLQLEGTHYEDTEDEMQRRGLSLDEHDDDLVLM